MVKFLVNVGPLAIVAVALMVINYRAGGWSEVVVGCRGALKTTQAWLIPLALIFLTMGHGKVIFNRHEDFFKAGVSGKNGLAGSCVAGLISPGIMAVLPEIKKMWEDGLPVLPLIMYFVSARLINFQVLLMMVPGIGWRIAFINFLVGVAIVFISYLILSAYGWVAEMIPRW